MPEHWNLEETNRGARASQSFTGSLFGASALFYTQSTCRAATDQ